MMCKLKGRTDKGDNYDVQIKREVGQGTAL